MKRIQKTNWLDFVTLFSWGRAEGALLLVRERGSFFGKRTSDEK